MAQKKLFVPGSVTQRRDSVTRDLENKVKVFGEFERFSEKNDNFLETRGRYYGHNFLRKNWRFPQKPML
jgi:hypothetical protein